MFDASDGSDSDPRLISALLASHGNQVTTTVLDEFQELPECNSGRVFIPIVRALLNRNILRGKILKQINAGKIITESRIQQYFADDQLILLHLLEQNKQNEERDGIESTDAKDRSNLIDAAVQSDENSVANVSVSTEVFSVNVDMQVNESDLDTRISIPSIQKIIDNIPTDNRSVCFNESANQVYIIPNKDQTDMYLYNSVPKVHESDEEEKIPKPMIKMNKNAGTKEAEEVEYLGRIPLVRHSIVHEGEDLIKSSILDIKNSTKRQRAKIIHDFESFISEIDTFETSFDDVWLRQTEKATDFSMEHFRNKLVSMGLDINCIIPSIQSYASKCFETLGINKHKYIAVDCEYYAYDDGSQSLREIGVLTESSATVYSLKPSINKECVSDQS